MTELEKIEARQAELRAVKALVVAELRTLAARRDELVAIREAEALVAGLSDAQRAALHQVVAPAGVESTESVGEPGA